MKKVILVTIIALGVLVLLNGGIKADAAMKEVWVPDGRVSIFDAYDGLTDEEAFVTDIFNWLCDERRSRGLGNFLWDESLAESAEIRAAESNVCWAHVRPDGSDYHTVGESVYAENLFRCDIGKGPTTALTKWHPCVRTTISETVVRKWCHSPAHEANLFNSLITKIGIGVHVNDLGLMVVAAEFSYGDEEEVRTLAIKYAQELTGDEAEAHKLVQDAEFQESFLKLFDAPAPVPEGGVIE